ncbi:MAG: ATP-binding cassette domain-containing protein [Psychrilyobacter sp.]|uniref:ABC transporter ATP-binding protein n=1 Tax=Psychrilyobacter sp. TaxID=2586924 RepID=UPI003C724509
MLKINNLNKSFHSELGTEKKVFKGLDFQLNHGDFVSIIGSNGAGKSTLLNIIMGNTSPDSGKLYIENKEFTNLASYKRNTFISKVYQNPTLGTAPSMTIFENLSMADNKGKKFNLTLGLNKKKKEIYKNILTELGLGLEKQLDTEVGLLSGGQRQCLALIMATLNKPKILLLDEHTAALDPQTSKLIMEKTKKIVEANNIPTLMITHNLSDAIKYGNRLIMLHEGKIILDFKDSEKQDLTPEKLLRIFQTKNTTIKDDELFSL